jgi:hypothetical protein
MLKPVIIIAIAFVLLIPIPVFAQSFQRVEFTETHAVIVGIFFVIIMVIISKFYKRRKPGRRGFSQGIKDEVDRRQRGECNACHTIPRYKKYDHINKNSDNSLGNCQMLCGDCHDDKTARERAWRNKR